MVDPPSHRIVEFTGWLVKRTDPDTIGTIVTVPRPKREAGLGINMPGTHPLPVRNIMNCACGFAVHDALAGAFFSAFFTNPAKIPYTKLNRSVWI